MTNRWWAPSGPHLGPDEQDFTLLTPVGQPRADLGSALLALHRVGAAACEEAALVPVPDERTLIETVAKAREVFAPPLVESVSKSVSTPNYAGLLVRDVFDDAEQGALDVYTAAVSKGVPGALAIQRAGLVYGVPPDGLGTFKTLACDLRAHPAALQDAADRALFSYIEKLASEEFTEPELPWEPVSKAPKDQRARPRTEVITDDEVISEDDPATDFYDARNRLGRFTRGRTAGPPEVGTTPARAKRSVRATRDQRAQRAQRAVPRAQSASRTGPQRAGATRGGIQRHEQTRARGRDVVRLGRTREPRSDVEDETFSPTPKVEWSDGSYMKPLRNTTINAPVDHETAIAYSREEWADLQKHLEKDPKTGKLRFRMGHVAQERDANTFGRASDYETDEHRRRLRWFSDQEVQKLEDAGVDYDLPIAVTIDDDEVRNLEPLEAWEVIHGKKFDAVADWMRKNDIDPLANAELREQLIKRMKSNRSPDGTGDVYAVEPPKREGFMRPKIGVIEIIFDGNVRGYNEGTDTNTDYQFDSNQVIEIQNSRPEVIYDPAIGATRLRYYASPIYDENGNVIKADEPWDENEVVRDRLGRFAVETRGEVIADDEVIEDEPVTRRTRSTRSTRDTRYQRALRSAPRARPFEVTRGEPQRGRLERTGASRGASRSRLASIQRELVKHQIAKPQEKQKAGARELLEHGAYRVLPMSVFAEEMEELAGEDPRDPIRLSTTSAKDLIVTRRMGGREADFAMREMTDAAISEKKLVALNETGLPPLKITPDMHPSDVAAAISDRADTLLRRNPDIEQVQIFYNGEGSPTFYGNGEPAPPVVMIEHQHGIDYDKPLQVRYSGELDHDDFVPDFDEPIVNLKMMQQELERDPEFDTGLTDDEWDTSVDEAESNAVYRSLMPLKYTRPKVQYWMLENADPTTDEDR